MGVAEFSADFDGGQVRPQVIALGRRPGALEIQLSRKPMVYLHTVQREIALIGVGFREAGRSPLGFVDVFGVGQVILAGTRSQTVRVKGCRAIAHPADLTGTRRRNIPSVPSGREHMLAAEQNTPNPIVGPPNLVVERRHAGTALNPGRRVDAAAVRAQ